MCNITKLPARNEFRFFAEINPLNPIEADTGLSLRPGGYKRKAGLSLIRMLELLSE